MQRANMNQYMDYVMEGVAAWLRAGGVTPFDLPDLREGFSYKPLLIEYSGWVDLSGGKLLDIENVYRHGDSFMSYDRLLLRIEVEAALTSINVSGGTMSVCCCSLIRIDGPFQFYYDYVTTIMGLGIFEGWVDGKADNIVIHADFLIDMYDFYIFMQDFEVKSIGNIDVRLRGNLLTDWIGNVMIDIITWLFKSTITDMVSERVKVFVQQTLDDINAGRFAASGATGASSDPGYGAKLPLYEMVRMALAKEGIQLPEQAPNSAGV